MRTRALATYRCRPRAGGRGDAAYVAPRLAQRGFSPRQQRARLVGVKPRPRSVGLSLRRARAALPPRAPPGAVLLQRDGHAVPPLQRGQHGAHPVPNADASVEKKRQRLRRRAGAATWRRGDQRGVQAEQRVAPVAHVAARQVARVANKHNAAGARGACRKRRPRPEGQQRSRRAQRAQHGHQQAGGARDGATPPRHGGRRRSATHVCTAAAPQSCHRPGALRGSDHTGVACTAAARVWERRGMWARGAIEQNGTRTHAVAKCLSVLSIWSGLARSASLRTTRRGRPPRPARSSAPPCQC